MAAPGSLASWNVAPGSDVDLKKKMAFALLQQSMDASPVGHWTQALARAAQGGMGGLLMNASNQDDEAERSRGRDLIAALSGGTQTVPQAPVPQAPISPTAPRDNKVSSALMPMIQQAADRHGIDPGYLAKTVQIENRSGNPNLVNPTSRAAGLMQFIPSTWKQYGNGASPLDPSANLDAGARLTVDNMAALERGIGRKPTFGESYLAHQQGAGGAIALLKNPSANVVDALSTAYGGNRSRAAQAVVLNGGSLQETAGQFSQRWTSKFTDSPPASSPVGAPVDQPRGGMSDPRRMQIINSLVQNRYTAPIGQQLLVKELDREATRARPLTEEEKKIYPGAVAIKAGGEPIFPPPATNISLSADKEGSELMAKKGVENFEIAQNASRDAGRRIAGYGQMLEAMKGFTPGATAELRLQGGRLLKDLGITSGEGVPDAETFKAIQRRLELAATPKGQGQITENERVLIRETIPSLTTSPEGIVKTIQMLDRLDRYDQQVAQVYRENAKRNGGRPNYLEVTEEIAKLPPPLTDSEMNSLQNARDGSVPSPVSKPALSKEEIKKKYGLD